MKTLLVFTTFSAVLCAQVATRASSGGPLVGFLNGPGALEVTPILGIASAAFLDAPMRAPEGVTKMYLPPRQQYALVEQQSSEPMGVWDLQARREDRAVRTVRGALPHADLAVFSPKGSSAALYSSSQGRLQILTGLPGRASVKAEVASDTLGTLAAVAVSDDGAVVLTKTVSGQFNLWSGGADWRLLPWSYLPLAWSFVAGSHDVVLSDSNQTGVLLLHQVDGPNSPAVVLMNGGGSPDSLAMTGDGENVIAGDSVHHGLWSIELKTGSVKAVAGRQGQTGVVTLRDGHTFLVSFGADSSFSLLKVAEATAQPVLLVHAGSSLQIPQGGAQ